MIIIVTDTNFFIDLIRLGALGHFFQLNYEICTTDLVIEGLRLPDHQQQIENYLRYGKLKIITLDDSEIQKAIQLPTQCYMPGIVGRSALLKAIELSSLVVSSDDHLSRECEHFGLEVHDLLWIIHKIHTAGLITQERSIQMRERLGKTHHFLQKVMNGRAVVEAI